MAYKNIVWVKLERRLLNDYRWYQMSRDAQLLYVKFILIAAETYNKIPKSIPTLSSLLRNEFEVGQLKSAIREIQKNFSKFKSNRYFYYFDEFENKTNWLPTEQSLSNRSAIAQHSGEKNRIEKKRKDKEPPKKHGAIDKSVNKKDSVFTDKEKVVLEAVRAKTNIYALIEEFKNVHKVYPPKDLLLRVCQQFLDKGVDIQEPYPYLKAALHRAAQDEESLNWKKEGMAQPLKEILGIK
jgi:hypothetical protein